MHLCTKFELCSCIRSTYKKGVPKVQNDDPMLMTLTFCTQNQIDSLQQTVEGLLQCQVSNYSDQRFSFHHANMHTYMYTLHTSTKWSLYPCCRTASSRM